MIQTNLIPHGHADLVTHVAYDFYGERLATCSADQKIKLFKRSADGSWDIETEWKAHDAPIIHLSFAHPLHGSLLASCSHDRSVRIWEEPSASASHPVAPHGGVGGVSLPVAPAPAPAPAAVRDGRWLEKGVLSGARGSVRSVEFGPPDSATGLRVASIATDSHLRLYTSLDPHLSDWSETHDVHVPSLPAPLGADDSSADPRTSQTHLQAQGGAGAGGSGGSSAQEAATGGWALSWCKETWWGSLVAVIAGTSPIVKIINLDQTPTALLHLSPPSTASASSAPLTSVSWAPSCGRSYHHLATGSRDGTVRIWKVTPPAEEGDVRAAPALSQNANGIHANGQAAGEDESSWRAEVVAEFTKGARVGTVDWNATGTVLTVSDDDGIIRMYKATYAKEWKLAGKITAEEPADTANGH